MYVRRCLVSRIFSFSLRFYPFISYETRHQFEPFRFDNEIVCWDRRFSFLSNHNSTTEKPVWKCQILFIHWLCLREYFSLNVCFIPLIFVVVVCLFVHFTTKIPFQLNQNWRKNSLTRKSNEENDYFLIGQNLLFIKTLYISIELYQTHQPANNRGKVVHCFYSSRQINFCWKCNDCASKAIWLKQTIQMLFTEFNETAIANVNDNSVCGHSTILWAWCLNRSIYLYIHLHSLNVCAK